MPVRLHLVRLTSNAVDVLRFVQRARLVAGTSPSPAGYVGSSGSGVRDRPASVEPERSSCKEARRVPDASRRGVEVPRSAAVGSAVLGISLLRRIRPMTQIATSKTGDVSATSPPYMKTKTEKGRGIDAVQAGTISSRMCAYSSLTGNDQMNALRPVDKMASRGKHHHESREARRASATSPAVTSTPMQAVVMVNARDSEEASVADQSRDRAHAGSDNISPATPARVVSPHSVTEATYDAIVRAGGRVPVITCARCPDQASRRGLVAHRAGHPPGHEASARFRERIQRILRGPR